MARTRTINERLYQPGIYGPFSVDSRDDCQFIRAEFTRVNWPQGNVLRVTMLWPDGSGMRAVLTGDPPSDGEVNASVTMSIPVVGTGRKNVTGCSVTVEVLQPLRTAVTISAV